MQLSYKPYLLELRHTFRVASGARSVTPVVLTQLEHDGVVGYGEASMPPYLGETTESVMQFLQKVDLKRFNSPFLIDDILEYVDSLALGNNAAKAAVDIALHDLVGKLSGTSLHQHWGLDTGMAPLTSFTIGIDTPAVMQQKVLEADSYKILKLKLGTENDKELVEAVRRVTSKPLYVDINQGWSNREMALEMTYWLMEQGVQLIEQPLPKGAIDDLAWLTSRSPLPIIADEGIRRLSDLESYYGAYSGINIKLMKSTGLREGRMLLQRAKQLGLKVMVGCMTETSCAISAAAILGLLSDYADLDGALLIKNDIFSGVTFCDGRVVYNQRAGIGVVPI